ncbi:hypothetical protein [Bradyrhizobium sp. USDA 329]|uniref:hypothetical protein n=1 Tax=unclassified Bradyrhizobium TaxID=2631580 RepID=UPI003517F774
MVRHQALGPHLDPSVLAVRRKQVAIQRIIAVLEERARPEDELTKAEASELIEEMRQKAGLER